MSLLRVIAETALFCAVLALLYLDLVLLASLLNVLPTV